MFERTKEFFLEAEVRKLSFLYELCGELSEGIHSKHSCIFIMITPDLVEVLTQHLKQWITSLPHHHHQHLHHSSDIKAVYQ